MTEKYEFEEGQVWVTRQEWQAELDVKRLYLPITILADCPKCGREASRDLSEDYLSYPVIGQEESIGFDCSSEDEECCEFEVLASLEVSIKAVAYGDVTEYGEHYDDDV